MQPFLTALLCLFLGPLASPGVAQAADWRRLTVHGKTIAVASAEALRVSWDGGATFSTVPIQSPRALAATAAAVFVASPDGVSRITRRGVRPVRLPPEATVVRALRAGPGWLMLIAEASEPALAFDQDGTYLRARVFLRQNGGWRRLFESVPSSADNAMTTLRVGPDGHAIASLIYTAQCGGVSIAGGEVWRPGGRAQGLPAAHAIWELPAGIHRDWILGACPRRPTDCDGECPPAETCLYDPSRRAQPVPDAANLPSGLHISPDARWVAVTRDATVQVHARSRSGLVEVHRVAGQVVAARDDGVTIRTPEGTLIRAGVNRVALGPLPPQTKAVDIDSRGRLFALSPSALLTLTPHGWTPLKGL